MTDNDNQDATRSVVRNLDGNLVIEVESAYLSIDVGSDAGREFPLGEGPVLIGRSDEADLVLQDSSVSRLHAKLTRRSSSWLIEDLGSKSGIEVDGKPVTTAELTPGSRVALGETLFTFRCTSAALKVPAVEPTDFHGLLSQTSAMHGIFSLVRRLAPLDLPVLITGESGTGKERLAQTFHLERGDPSTPWEIVDCGLLSGEHLRSELFGHVRGAFTGANKDRDGALRRAHGGTIFFDEVGELPLDLQPTLLRCLQEGEVRPLGSDQRHTVRVRVVAATNRDLREEVAAGRFRQDLYYRLAGIEVVVPPLRERIGDLSALCERFLPAEYSLSQTAKEALQKYPWPGNIRQLEHTLRRAVALADDHTIRPQHLALSLSSDSASKADPNEIVAEAGTPGLLTDRIAATEAQALQAALEKAGGNRSAAARALGISRATFYRKLQRAGLDT